MDVPSASFDLVSGQAYYLLYILKYTYTSRKILKFFWGFFKGLSSFLMFYFPKGGPRALQEHRMGHKIYEKENVDTPFFSSLGG